jgi:hypothetical protein
MDNVEMDFTDLSKEATTEAILMEGTLDSPSSAELEEVHSWTDIAGHNKPKKANRKVIPEGT